MDDSNLQKQVLNVLVLREALVKAVPCLSVIITYYSLHSTLNLTWISS